MDAPANTRASLRDLRSRKPDQITVNELRQIHPSLRTGMVPQVEARVDLEQTRTPRTIPLEI